MLELIILIRFCVKAGEQLKAKGYKPLKYYFLFPVAWFGMECLTAILVGFIYAFVTRGQGEPNLAIIYLPALLAAFLSAVLLSKRIEKKPKLEAATPPPFPA
ncbi:hypothetical protein [Coraliomargarita parva]|uniref:hypothetical protein n=1 Tax=Coraliomargarita parva TaxID=3014050 RepID=UPI0022B5287B|nr:hypothetical protein [Coraliomargarita parva]